MTAGLAGPGPVAPPWHAVEAAVGAALAEDLGLAGDVTTAALVDPDASGRGQLRFRSGGVLAGTWAVEAVCGRFDLYVSWGASDGDLVPPGESAGEIEGSLADLLTAERTALNFLTHLSGVATVTRQIVQTLDDLGSPMRVRDTRKTLPGLRALQKAAVRAGGGVNHRMGLFDSVLVKDNHLAGLRAQGRGIRDAVELSRTTWPGLPVEIEADTLEQAVETAEAGADMVLVDNMTPEEVAAVVEAVAGRVTIEISGGVNAENIEEYAACGADFVAIGALTHSAPAVDIGLDIV